MTHGEVALHRREKGWTAPMIVTGIVAFSRRRRVYDVFAFVISRRRALSSSRRKSAAWQLIQPF
jgi:hypothetical protein